MPKSKKRSRSRKRSRKGSVKLHLKLKKGELLRYGYNLEESAVSRHRALARAVRASNPLKVFRRINILAVYNKHRNALLRKLEADKAWMRKRYMFVSSRKRRSSKRSRKGSRKSSRKRSAKYRLRRSGRSSRRKGGDVNKYLNFFKFKRGQGSRRSRKRSGRGLGELLKYLVF